MARVKIKSENSKEHRRKQKLLEILSTNEIYVTKIIDNRDGFVIITSNEQELDKILNGTTDQILEDNNFSPQLPPELQAQRSIMIFNVDQYIYSHSAEEMKQEISSNFRLDVLDKKCDQIIDVVNNIRQYAEQLVQENSISLTQFEELLADMESKKKELEEISRIVN